MSDLGRPKLVFTRKFEGTVKEVESVGGQVLHRLTAGMAVIALPPSAKLSELKTCSTKKPAKMKADDKIVYDAWRATQAHRGTGERSLMTRSAKDDLSWDEAGLTAHGEYDPGKPQARSRGIGTSRSTGIPTSLYLTGRVAVGVIVVSGEDWHQIPGKLKHVSVAEDGTVWGVNSSDNIYRRVGSSWQRIAGKLKQISVGSASKVWGVNSSDNIYRRVGNSWQRVPGKLKHVSVASDGTVWGVNASDNIYRRVGSGWQQVAGKLKQISVGSSSKVWGVNSANNIYQRVGSSWKRISGKLKYVSVAKDGAVFGVNSSDVIYRRAGNAWASMPGRLKQISTAGLNKLWGVNSADNIYTGTSASGLNLSTSQKVKIVQEVQEGLNFLTTANPSAKVSFHYDFKFVQVDATPGPDPSISNAYASYEDGWRNAVMKKLGYAGTYNGVVDYVKKIKSNLNTDWAYAAFFTQYPLNHFAYAGGVRSVMDYDNDGWGPDLINRVFAHESCHIFGAADEYGGCGCGNSGFYGIPNNNCKNCTSNQVDCLMNANTLSICKWSGGQIGWSFWEQVAGKLKHVSVAKDGTVWGVNAADSIYKRGGGSWQRMAGKLKQISVGSSTKIWGVNSADNIYRRAGSSWQRVAGKLKHVSVGSDGTVWGVNASDNIYRRVGSSWQRVAGKLKQISVGSSSKIWGVNSADNIYRRVGSSWQRVPGKLKYVSVASDGTVWGVNAADRIYVWKGTGWVGISGRLEQVSVGDPKKIWGVNSADNIYERNVLATP